MLFNRIDLVCTDKDRELSEAQAEIKALKLSERQREKAVEEVHPLLKKARKAPNFILFFFFYFA